jgi:hypothetical protein
VGVVVQRDDERDTMVKGNNDGGWISDGVVLWLGRRKMEMWLSGGESDHDWMTFLWQWRVRVRRSRKGGRRWRCRFNASVSGREVR